MTPAGILAYVLGVFHSDLTAVEYKAKSFALAFTVKAPVLLGVISPIFSVVAAAALVIALYHALFIVNPVTV